MTTVPGALESLELQKQRHLSEIPVIKHKRRCAEMKKAMQPTSPPTRSPSQPEMKNINTGAANGKQGKKDDVDRQLSVYRTMEKCDSLIAFLKNRAAGQNVENNSYNEKGHARADITGIKTPKDDKTIIEVLRIHNDALRLHILELLRENEGYCKELQTLRKENVELFTSRNSRGRQDGSILEESTDSEKSEKYYPNPNRIDINDIPSMELPPLEMPTFDFDSLNKLSDSQ